MLVLRILLGLLSHAVWVEVCPERISRSVIATAERKFVKTNFLNTIVMVESTESQVVTETWGMI